MILAAGRGERMRPLTDACPKPLLLVRGKPLIDWHVDALVRGGFDRLLINTDWLGEQIPAYFSAREGTAGAPVITPTITYSDEGRDFGGALETAGGITRALPQLDEVFWVVAGDVFVPGFEFTQDAVRRFEAGGRLAHIWLVPNPAHNPNGDFGLDADGLARNLPAGSDSPRYTFSTIALYRRAFFAGLPAGNPAGLKVPLAPLLRSAMDNRQVSASLYTGDWTDVGTPARLAELNQP
ncbi:MAG: nucleotidyltransferase family protein [Comamonadaceae bacterium]|nr:MAG: nucleotidyltransferase family protein [Comamonadaceae bacterium]